MKLLRLCTQHIRLNHPLPWNVRSEPGQLLLSKGFVLTSQAQIDALMARGMFVDQDEYEQHARQVAEEGFAKVDPFALWSNILRNVAQVLLHPDSPTFVTEIKLLSGTIQKAMNDELEVGSFEMLHDQPVGYAVMHSLQTAFVACLVAERFGWSEAERHTLLQASLTMNISMLNLQNVLAKQVTPPTPEQRGEIDAHPRKGRQMLEAAGVTDTDWLHTVEHHHVTQGGKPLPADRSALSPLACMIHYADVYLAKMSPRATRPALAVNVAARELYVHAGGPDNPYVAAIIKEMGIFPPGSYVKLANGDTGVVTRKGESASAPMVHSLISSDGWVFPDAKLRDTTKPEYKVVAAVPRDNVLLRLNRQRLFGYVAA
ncbi:HD-GYP domain-containing protein [Aquabacterium sp.]|uniref:HD-GYP domain-containing protein n=1 Tax=Aquabacterium sp. TaxID=1872578 RepID=UPI0027BA9714|nr:HD domain-containing phosphohydrolase [Aquabacterium sp.]